MHLTNKLDKKPANKKGQAPINAGAAASGVIAPASRLNFILICVFLDLLAIGLVTPVLPLLVGQFTGDNRAGQTLYFGLLTAVFGLMQFLCMPLLGALSDRIGRRPVLMISMAGLAINFMAMAWAPSLTWLFAGRLIGGAAAASMSVASAFAADISTPANRAAAFGKVGAAFGVGFICGPILGGILGSIDLRLPFYVACALSLANLLYGFLMVPESLPQSRRVALTWRRIDPFGVLARALRQRAVGGLLASYALMTFALVLLQSTWVLHTHFRFGWTAHENGIALFVVGLASAAMQAGALAPLLRKLGDRRLALVSLAAGALAYLLYGLAYRGWMMYLVIAINLLGFVAGPVLQSLISATAGEERQGELMGALQAIGSIGILLMPMLGMGILGQSSQLGTTDLRWGSAFYLAGLLQLGALLLAWRWLATHPQDRKTQH